MGQVYQATDTTLNRQVALKILPEAFATDPDRLARFQREAQVLASLNHPNIAAIHGIEETDDTRALVLELVEGPTLADRIAQGPIPVDEALPIAKQIAEALEAAHEAGVIHRDLKPLNVKVKDDGTVKVLDFGLAKALEDPGGDPSQSPTMTAAATQMGVIMGTAAYMSPEQARGRATDRRADIWSFGVVLFEMLTGQRAFAGEDVSVTLAAVIRADVAWDKLPSDLPRGLATYLRRCLEKEPRQRIQAIGDGRLAVDGAFETVATLPDSSSGTTSSGWRPAFLLALGTLVVGTVVGGFGVWSSMGGPEREPSVLRATVTPDGDTVISWEPFYPGLAISPDGEILVYEGRTGDGDFILYRRPLDALDAEQLRGTEGGVGPFFSPDGESIGFLTTGRRTRLKTLSLTGGAATTVATFPDVISGASWGTDDQVIVGQSVGGLFRVSAAGGEPEALTVLDEGDVAHRWPFIAHDGRVVFFTTVDERNDASGSQLAVLDLETGAVVRLGLSGSTPRYVATGHLIYVTDTGALQAVAFDLDELALLGDPVRVADAVGLKATGGADYTVSDTGRLAYVPAGSTDAASMTLAWVNRSGDGITPVGVTQETIFHPRLSPDEHRVAYTNGFEDIWVLDLVRQSDDRFTFDGSNLVPLCSRDGATIMFSSDRSGTFDIYSKPADSSEDASLMLEYSGTAWPGSVSSDGQQLLYQRIDEDGQRDLWVLPIAGTPGPILQSRFDEAFPSLSPDGRWVAYMSNSSGELRVYLQSFPSQAHS